MFMNLSNKKGTKTVKDNGISYLLITEKVGLKWIDMSKSKVHIFV